MTDFDQILSSIEDYAPNKISLEEICGLKPDVFTLENPLTYQIYLIENHAVLTEEERNKVVLIRDKLIVKQRAITEYNVKLFQEQGEGHPDGFNHLQEAQGEIDAPVE